MSQSDLHMKKNIFEFKIVSGSLKGKKITAPDLGITRPPLTRLRKSIFDFLMPYIKGADYLDLFSGTGSYLFEAVSRGAVSATGVELNRELVKSINSQATKFEVDNTLNCLCDDVFETIPELFRADKKFDIIIIAPPQYKNIIDATLKILGENNILKQGGLILTQQDSSETDKINFGQFKIKQNRKYGNTTFSVLNY